ncbi:MAG TPA: hypothetical protein PLL77_07865 [Pyrinomonadaceae bacterium]|nr:hypothetical protein [Pyrinomonadaceae bacterium]
MKTLLTLFIVTLTLSVTTAAQSAKISAKDLKPLEGGEWIGKLTYLDYQSKKPTSIKSNLTVTRSKTDKLTWTFDMQYPLEPKANSKDEVRLSPDGKTFDGETVIERTKLPDGTLRIVTSKPGKDDDRPATLRHTYLVSKKAFSIKKEVKLDSEAEYFERNTYSWTR